MAPATARATCVLAPNPGPMTLDGTNTWVLREPGEPNCVVVDPGPLHDEHLQRITAHEPIALIVLTHGHPDHAESAGRLHQLTNAPVLARDPSLCVDIEAMGDRDEIRYDVAGLDWLTVLTPGHSSDSVCLMLPSDRALLTGDTILGRGTTVVAHPDGQLREYLTSLQRLRDLVQSDVDVVLPGHGPIVSDPLGVVEFYLQHRAERLEQVRDAVAAGARTAMDVVRTVYADVDPQVWPAAELSVRAQMDYLQGD